MVPWQKTGTQLYHPTTALQAIRDARLDYEVQKKPVKTLFQGKSVPVEGHFAVVRQDTGRSLGIVKKRYTVIQNLDAFSFLTPLAGKDLQIERGGVIDCGRKAWLLVKLPQVMRIGPKKDGVRQYLLVVNSHDGSTNMVVKPTAIRIACSNTIPAVLRSSDPEIRIRHTAQAHGRIAEIHGLLKKAENTFQQLEYILNRMALRKLSDQELLATVMQLVPDNEDVESHTRTENLRKHILQSYHSGIGADIHRGNVFGLVNAVSEVTDHGSARDNNRHLKSIWFGGSGEKLKQRAFHLAEMML